MSPRATARSVRVAAGSASSAPSWTASRIFLCALRATTTRPSAASRRPRPSSLAARHEDVARSAAGVSRRRRAGRARPRRRARHAAAAGARRAGRSAARATAAASRLGRLSSTPTSASWIFQSARSQAQRSSGWSAVGRPSSWKRLSAAEAEVQPGERVGEAAGDLLAPLERAAERHHRGVGDEREGGGEARQALEVGARSARRPARCARRPPVSASSSARTALRTTKPTWPKNARSKRARSFVCDRLHLLEHERMAADRALAEDDHRARQDVGALDRDADRHGDVDRAQARCAGRGRCRRRRRCPSRRSRSARMPSVR